MKHSTRPDNIRRFGDKINNISYYFRNINVPHSTKDGQSFAFTCRAFSDPSLQTPIGLMTGTAILNIQNKDKEKHMLSISAQIDIRKSKAGPIKVDITCSAPLYPKYNWGGRTLIYNKCQFVHGTNNMKIYKGRIVEASLIVGSAGSFAE